MCLNGISLNPLKHFLFDEFLLVPFLSFFEFSPSYSEEAAKQSILYHYKHSFSGFSVKLNQTQAATLASNEQTISLSLNLVLFKILP